MKGRQGKLDSRTLERVVYTHLGASSRRVILGPGKGLDNAAISAGGRRVLILTTDPVSVIPGLGFRLSAWLSVHLIASDFTTSGLSPEFASFDFNLPLVMTAADQEAYLKAIGSTCKELGVAIVAGHTGSYPGAGFTVVGGGTMFGFGKKGGYVDPTMAREGDAVVMTKGVAIEAVASLANSFPKRTSRMVGRELAARAKALVTSCSTVKDALAAATIGLGEEGVTSMHDATEGGILGGLDEMAAASGHSIVVDKERILMSRETSAVCAAFGIDPLASLSEGTLLLTVARGRADELTDRLRKEGIPAAAVGTVGRGAGLWIRGRDGRLRRARPTTDPYWEAYAAAVKSGFD